VTLRNLLVSALRNPGLGQLGSSQPSSVVVGQHGRALALAGLSQGLKEGRLIAVTPTSREAQELAVELRAYLGSSAVKELPGWETLPFERMSPGLITMGQRLECRWLLGERPAGWEPEQGSAAALWGSTRPPQGTEVPGCSDAQGRLRVVVMGIKALLQRVSPYPREAAPICLSPGMSLDRDELVRKLVGAGYRREYQVEHPGELAVRGLVLDVWPITEDGPVRLEFFGDDIERVSRFEVDTQRSQGNLDQVVVWGCREFIPDDRARKRATELAEENPWASGPFASLAAGELFDGMESWLPWLQPEETTVAGVLGPEDCVVLVDPGRAKERALGLLEEERQLASELAITWGAERSEVCTEDVSTKAAPRDAGSSIAPFPQLHLDPDLVLGSLPCRLILITGAPVSSESVEIELQGWEHGLAADPEGLAERLSSMAQSGWEVVVAAEDEVSAARMASWLSASSHGASGVTVVVEPGLHGWRLPQAKAALLTESDITGRKRVALRQPTPIQAKASRRQRLPQGDILDDLLPGSYVVHRVHGIAKYVGMARRAIAGAERDYVVLEYRGHDRLYVPTDQLDAITPYTGGETPTLSRMGGADWERTRARARSAARKVAKELVALYRARLRAKGQPSGPDTPWQRELEESFPYVETPDQLQAILDTKADLEREVPMDRLVVGDVGFGKTEVALRAVFKVVQAGQQAAVLVPTTLLAQQHWETFTQRLAPFPLRVEALSRFVSASQAKKILEGLADGSVDVVIGTHRLLSQDVRFKKLGLLVVDEEHRFGVSHKEAIKKLSIGVHVLSLSANPIPRTLEMGLTGIKELSFIGTPPVARQPVLTYVGPYDEQAVSEAVRRELLREGQVFFVHDRIRDIDFVAERISELVPSARVAVAHGQMEEGALEQVMLDFAQGRYDVLVCTTIIEAGIDMPSVNTLVTDCADRLGLGQLHQLRGRVGRSGQRAYAYLLYPPGRRLTEEAVERLRTIGEHTALGSGLRIAMKDLEIRGAGSLLGKDQSGHIAAVGYDLYMQMIHEEMLGAQGKPLPPAPVEVRLDLVEDAYLPQDYIAREDLRLQAYRELATVEDVSKVDEIAASWADRYGPIPGPAQSLLEVGRLRAACVRRGISEVSCSRLRPGDERAAALGLHVPPGSQLSQAVLVQIKPVSLPPSKRVRLERKYPRARYRESTKTLLVVLADAKGSTRALRDLIEDLLEESDLPSRGSGAQDCDPAKAATG
jgi:transcription-repair coupling factor (superfamily II helicase)